MSGNRLRLVRLVRLGRLSGATVYVHWSVLLIAGLLLIGAIENAASTLFLVSAYLGILLLHEYGHLLAAQRRGYAVWSIELYPFHGFTRYAAPHTHYDACVVAWGGVLAQLAVAAPLILWAGIFGFTSIGVVNGVIAMFGYLSTLVAIFNLMPAPRLDGAIAWQIVPYLWRRIRALPSRRLRSRTSSRRPSRPKGGWVH